MTFRKLNNLERILGQSYDDVGSGGRPIQNTYEPQIAETEDLWKSFDLEELEKLSEVVVVGKKRSDQFYLKQEAIKKYKSLVPDIGKYYLIELPEDFGYYETLMPFLGYKEGIRLAYWQGKETYLATGVNNEALLFIDRKVIESNQHPVYLEMKHVENIMIQPVGGSKYIHVFTNDAYNNDAALLENEYVFKRGYDKAKKYEYSLKHLNDTTLSSMNCFSWLPDVQMNTGDSYTFKVKKEKDIEIHIQGFTNNGFLINELFEVF